MFPSGMAANLFDAMRGFAGPMAAFGDALAQPPTQNTQPQQPQNTPPASERAIASLPMVKITIDDLQEESNKECLICLEEQKLGTIACKLPCGHIFHRKCIVDWLQRHGSCPFCRYEIETNDPNYEIQRKQNMKNRKLRYRRDELDHKSISQLRELCSTLKVGIHGCVDKRDIVDRLVASGKIAIAEGAGTMDIPSHEFDSMSVRELQHLLLSFGISAEGLLEKNELKSALINSGRINIIESSHHPPDDMEMDDPQPIDNASSSSSSKASYENNVASSESSREYSYPDPTPINPAAASSGNDANSDMLAAIRESLEHSTVKDLKLLARENNVDISRCIEKDDIISRISVALAAHYS